MTWLGWRAMLWWVVTETTFIAHCPLFEKGISHHQMKLHFQEAIKLLTTCNVSTNSPYLYYQNGWTIFFTVWVTIAIIIKVCKKKKKKPLVLKVLLVVMYMQKSNGTGGRGRGREEDRMTLKINFSQVQTFSYTRSPLHSKDPEYRS